MKTVHLLAIMTASDSAQVEDNTSAKEDRQATGENLGIEHEWPIMTVHLMNVLPYPCTEANYFIAFYFKQKTG